MKVARQSIAITCLALAACVGQIGDAGDPEPSAQEFGDPCSDGQLGIQPLPPRRLNALQYQNTLRDLVGDPEFGATVDDTEGLITERMVRQYRDAAELLVERRAMWSREVFPCDITGSEDLECLHSFIDQFGARAFRRPLREYERVILEDAFHDARSKSLSFEDSMVVVFETMLQAPGLLYLHEQGAPDASSAVRLLTEHEVASRLAYFLWDTMPDDALRAAAAEGTLSTVEGLREQTERMLQDPRSDAMVQRFFADWLQLEGGDVHDGLDDAVKDEELFGEFDAELRAAMRLETEALVRRAFFDPDAGGIDSLFTSRQAYVNGPLSEVYGVDGPSDAESYEWVTLDASERAGVLTRAAFLTVFATSKVQSPIKRGAWIYRVGLGKQLGDPPPNVDDTPPVGGEALTIRQDVEERTGQSEGVGCHAIINPLGFSLGHYDAIGRFRLNELGSGEPIDAQVELHDASFGGPVADVVELSQLLADSDAVRRNIADRWMRVALAGSDLADVVCERESLAEQFVEDGDMHGLVVSLISSNNFRYVAVASDASTEPNQQ